MNRELIAREVTRLGPWFHNMDLGGVATAPKHFLGDYPRQKFRRFEHAIPRDLRGMTVLDIMTDEELQENARDTGDHLKARLEALGQRFPIVGAVHGMGLYLGLEFVRDHKTLQPATEETAAICDRLLDLGVIMQPTGDYLNVLKIKPPLCLTRESADFFADSLARVLEEGW